MEDECQRLVEKGCRVYKEGGMNGSDDTGNACVWSYLEYFHLGYTALWLTACHSDESAWLHWLAFSNIKGLTNGQFFPSGLTHLAAPQQHT